MEDKERNTIPTIRLLWLLLKVKHSNNFRNQLIKKKLHLGDLSQGYINWDHFEPVRTNLGQSEIFTQDLFLPIGSNQD